MISGEGHGGPDQCPPNRTPDPTPGRSANRRAPLQEKWEYPMPAHLEIPIRAPPETGVDVPGSARSAP